MSSTEKRDDFTRRVPFVALRTYLGDTNKVVSHRHDGVEYHRRWACGCTAILRESAQHTARWRPCAEHAARRGTTADPRAASYVRKRVAPRFFIVDRNLRVLSIAPNAGLESLIPAALVRLSDRTALAEPTLVPLDGETWLRTMPLAGPAFGDATVVFFESGEVRGSIQRAAERYGLSKREMDVLKLLLDGQSNADIAKALFIAESTVHDHVKNIYRKTQSTRRSELIGKLLHGDA
jgi:DNA-binding CsgD family transcriptional regulator